MQGDTDAGKCTLCFTHRVIITLSYENCNGHMCNVSLTISEMFLTFVCGGGTPGI